MAVFQALKKHLFLALWSSC